MNAQQTAHAQDIFGEAIELTAMERPAFIASACNGDKTVQREVETLLTSIEDAGSFLTAPTSGAEPNFLIAANEIAIKLEVPGTHIDRYQLLRELGEGGFGSVFEAQQEYPVRRRVALKIIKLGMDTRQVIARFEAERQALAMMDHPNIARVFDAGATDTGRPYFVMELVEGVPITCYCDAENFSTADRLNLFVEVCQAVQHAHQKGVIHRDLKPSNVLVASRDGKPVSKVIDFGIAKATSGRLTERTLITEFRHLIGTPQYMSPEQAQFDGIDVDTRSDVYSLGVLLYELLTGATPFDAKVLRDAGQEVGKLIREKEPPKPSTRLSAFKEDLPIIAARRGIDPRFLAKSMRGELDWIVMKCLEKDRTRRYDTASALAADIKRYLSDEPVVARAISTRYRLRKFVLRHKTAALAVAVALVGLVGGLTVATYGFIRAMHERDAAIVARLDEGKQRQAAETATAVAQQQRAEAIRNEVLARIEVAKSDAIHTFLADILASPRPDQAMGKTVLVRDVLDQAARKIESGDFNGQPEIEASVRQTLGRSYFALGEYRAAESQLRTAIALTQKTAGTETPLVAYMLGELSQAVGWGGDRVGAIAIARQALAMQQHVNGEASRYAAYAMETLAADLSHLGQNEEAHGLVGCAIEIRRKLGERETPSLAFDLVLDGDTMDGDPPEKEQLLRQGLAMQRSLLPENHPDIAHTLHNLGVLLVNEGNLEEAKVVYQEALAIKLKVLPSDHPDLESTLNGLSGVLRQLQDWKALEPVLLAHYAWQVKRNPDSPAIKDMQNIEHNYQLMGKPELAESWHLKVQDAIARKDASPSAENR